MTTEHAESNNSATSDDATVTHVPELIDDPETQQKIIEASELLLNDDGDDIDDIYRAEMLIQSITPEEAAAAWPSRDKQPAGSSEGDSGSAPQR
ncbi:hypothetical protein [Nocardia sp. NPDC059239]|uniref:hypothetical protein n=1 Tax=Nocardia sp. NPDC059239 TaxID=3346785 RepID=UPI0036765353